MKTEDRCAINATLCDGQAGSMMQHSRLTRYVWIILPFPLLMCFVITFNPDVNRWLVTFTWLAALLSWAFGIWRSDPPAASGRINRGHVWVLVAFVAVFAATWLPLYDNWRWSDVADSLGWYVVPYQSVRNGLFRSILSVRGVGDLFTYTEVIVVNGLMFVFGPSFFWHRAGNFIISTLSLVAIYTFFSLILDFPWALFIIVATAATWHFQLLSHLSWDHIDSFLFAYAMLSAFTLVLRDPERRRRWLAAGAVGGLSLFFTPTAWSEVAACGICLGLWALYRRKFLPLAITGTTFVIAGLPVLLQLPQLFAQTANQSRIDWHWSYLSRIFEAILWLPAGRNLASIGFNGAFASWPCGELYFAGLVIAVIALVPAIRRRLRVPPAVVGLLFLLLAEVLLMTVTNNLNGNPSPKRTYHLIPLQAFFALLPLYTLAVAFRPSSLRYRAVTATALLAVGVYVVVGASLIIYPDRFGGNVYDALIRLRQWFPHRKVLVLSPHPWIEAEVRNPEAVINTVYHVSDTTLVTQAIDESTVAATCSTGGILCARPEDTNEIKRAAGGQQFRKINLFAIGELQCFDCPLTKP
jgi:hypothetical protein